MPAAATPAPGPLIACPDCDLLLRGGEAAPVGAVVRCPRCGAELFRVRAEGFDKAFALILTALILLLIANAFPIVGLNLQGHRIEATLLGAAHRLWAAEMPILALLVGLTTVFIPAAELLAMLWLVYPLRGGRRPPGFAWIMRGLHMTHPWGMVEVFLLGVLVSLVKLAHLAEVLPSIGIWAYGALMLLFTALGASFDSRKLWHAWAEARP